MASPYVSFPAVVRTQIESFQELSLESQNKILNTIEFAEKMDKWKYSYLQKLANELIESESESESSS